jgi:hypothetical protein
MAERTALDVPRCKKVLYRRGGEREVKWEELEAYKPHDLGENWPHERPPCRAPNLSCASTARDVTLSSSSTSIACIKDHHYSYHRHQYKCTDGSPD